MSETYQALYRKWRPMTFADVVGQKHVSDTLKTGIATGRIAHAYLFCGTRGTGKTSTAKIFSRAVNCENPQDGEPCNQCPTCKGILDGSILDVYEMDAASNRGVENIREIRDEVIYTPAGCTYKVYIIDEVHMLTAEAFNALLKTLEEPPKHALFILATTEPHKIPATVLSRCQRFDFRRIRVADISERLTKIAEAEDIAATPAALELVAELGDGSMRDALSILDQCAAFGLQELTREHVIDIVGIVDSKILFDVAEAVAADKAGEALAVADAVLKQGKEALNFLEDLIGHFRSLMICKAVEEPAELLERTAEAAARYQEQAALFSVERILYSIKTLSEYLAQAKWMSVPQVAVEMAMVKLCSPVYSTDMDGLLARVEKLEQAIGNGGVVWVGTESAPRSARSSSRRNDSAHSQEEMLSENVAKQGEASEKPKPFGSDAAPSSQTGGEPWNLWAEALNAVKKESKALFAFLYKAKAWRSGNTINLELGGQMAYERIGKPEGIAYLANLFSRVAGETLNVRALLEGEQQENDGGSPGPSIQDLAGKKNMLGDKMTIIGNEMKE